MSSFNLTGSDVLNYSECIDPVPMDVFSSIICSGFQFKPSDSLWLPLSLESITDYRLKFYLLIGVSAPSDYKVS